jgi:hypothetical protein
MDVVPSAQRQNSPARRCRSPRRSEPSTSYVPLAATSASVDSRPSDDEAAIARRSPWVPSILAPHRAALPRSHPRAALRKSRADRALRLSPAWSVSVARMRAVTLPAQPRTIGARTQAFFIGPRARGRRLVECHNLSRSLPPEAASVLWPRSKTPRRRPARPPD